MPISNHPGKNHQRSEQQAKPPQIKPGPATSINKQGSHPAEILQRFHHSPNNLTPQNVLSLQRTLGNRVVVGLLGHLAPSSSSPTLSAGEPTIQRAMDWQDTDWSAAKRVKASTGGGMGVLFVNDNSEAKPIVVKTGETAEDETILAANLHTAMGMTSGSKATGGWFLDTPGARPVSPAESKKIQAALSRAQIEGNEKRAKNLITQLKGPGVMVYDCASGHEFKEELEAGKGTKHSKKGAFGKRTLRKDSPFKLLFNGGFATALGVALAGDIFMGNWDRLTASFNPENFLVDRTTKTINLIDNIYMNSTFAFTNKTVTYKDHKSEVSAEEAFVSWKRRDLVQQFAADQYGEIAKNTIEEGLRLQLSGYLPNNRSAKDLPPLLRKLNGSFKKGLIKGLQRGKAQLLTLQPKWLAKGIAKSNQNQAQQSIRKRLDFLAGTGT